MSIEKTRSSADQPWRRSRVGIICLLAASGLSWSVHAQAIPAACFDEASRRFGHGNSKVLQAVAAQESSGRCTKRHPVNANGSYDIGCMGINSSWLPTLRQKFGITEQDLRDPCVNVHVGAWVHARNVRRFGDTWRAVGAYNAVSEHKRVHYAWKIQHQLAALR